MNEDFVILHSIIESETQFHPEINFEPFLTYIDLENFEILRLKEFIEIETICLVIKNFKKKIHNESHSLLLDTVEDNLFSCDYYDSTIKKVKNYKTTQIISKFDEKTTFDEFYDSLKINRVDIENYESKNEKEIYELQYSILTQNMIGFVLFRLLLIKNTIVTHNNFFLTHNNFIFFRIKKENFLLLSNLQQRIF